MTDWYSDEYYAGGEYMDLTGPKETKEFRVLHGGSWAFDRSDVSVYDRGLNGPSAAFIDYGIRCVQGE